MSFESDMSRLNEIVKKLESDELSLEESRTLYKEGADLSVRCKKTLEEAKLTVKQVNEDKTNERSE